MGYGAVRAAAPDREARVGLPGLEDDALPLEQAAGGRPRPLGDIFALGAVLAYAATDGGRTPRICRRSCGALWSGVRPRIRPTGQRRGRCWTS